MKNCLKKLKNIYRDKLNKLGMPEDSMSLLSGVDMLSDPIKSKNILVKTESISNWLITGLMKKKNS